MILRRLFTLTALVVAASLSLSDRANAGYSFSTSVTNVSPSLTLVANPGATFTLPAGSGNPGGVVMPSGGATGYTTYTDSFGSTIYLVNNTGTNAAGGLSSPGESINIAAVGNDTTVFSFTVNVLVTNLVGGASSTFLEPATYTMGGAGAIATQAPPTPTLTPPTTMTIGGLSFTISSPLATQVAYNTVNTGGVSAQLTSVPEPASVVMLGIGLVGVVGLGLRRMKKQD